MRLSFVKSTLKSNCEKVHNIILEESKKFSNLKKNFFQRKSDKEKENKNFDASMDISFNLDKMYFESDASTEQNIKMQSVKSKKCVIDELQVSHIKQESDSQPKVSNQLKHLTQNQENTTTQKQEIKPKDALIKSETSENKSEQFHDSQPKFKELKDQEIQVDFSQTESSSNNSVEQLSEIDMLFIFPQNITKYNDDHPLQVTLSDLAKIYPLNLQLKNFVRLDPKCNQENVKKVFKAFMIDWGKSEERLSKKVLTLAKMRTIIIRDAMNNLVDELVPPVETEDYHFRISKTYRSRYIKSGIPIPPPRVNNSYLEGLFSHTQIKKYYQNYVEEKLQIFIKDQNYRRIEIYTLDLIQCLKLYHDKNVSELVQILQRKKKPFTNKQIELIIEEARKIGDEYGKDAKRIGNGIRRSKASQKSQKMLSKIVKINSQSNTLFKTDGKNQIFEEESDTQIQKMTRKKQKKVKLQEVTPQVKIEVKIEQISPKQKQNYIIIETPKVKKQHQSSQEEVKIES